MKDTARILKYRGRDLKSVADVTGAMQALAADLLNGDITPAEHRRIQKEINQRIRSVAEALKTVARLQQLEKVQSYATKPKNARKR